MNPAVARQAKTKKLTRKTKKAQRRATKFSLRFLNYYVIKHIIKTESFFQYSDLHSVNWLTIDTGISVIID